MRVQATPPPPDDARWASAEMLGLTFAQVRAWQAEALRYCLAPSRTEEQAWEDTEIDVRRTTL